MIGSKGYQALLPYAHHARFSVGSFAFTWWCKVASNLWAGFSLKVAASFAAQSVIHIHIFMVFGSSSSLHFVQCTSLQHSVHFRCCGCIRTKFASPGHVGFVGYVDNIRLHICNLAVEQKSSKGRSSGEKIMAQWQRLGLRLPSNRHECSSRIPKGP